MLQFGTWRAQHLHRERFPLPAINTVTIRRWITGTPVFVHFLKAWTGGCPATYGTLTHRRNAINSCYKCLSRSERSDHHTRQRWLTVRVVEVVPVTPYAPRKAAGPYAPSIGRGGGHIFSCRIGNDVRMTISHTRLIGWLTDMFIIMIGMHYKRRRRG